jgi:hypothetical protein
MRLAIVTGVALLSTLLWPHTMLAAADRVKEKLKPGESFDEPVSGASIVQLTNASKLQSLSLCCALVNENGHCSNNFTAVCSADIDCTRCIGLECQFGECVPGCSWTDFRFWLPPRNSQTPLIWSILLGVPALGIPPAPEVPFDGRLVCTGLGDWISDFECPLLMPCP